MYIYGPMSWILLGPIICLNNGKNKFYSWIKTFSGNQLQNNYKENIKDLIKPPDGVAILY